MKRIDHQRRVTIRRVTAAQRQLRLNYRRLLTVPDVYQEHSDLEFLG